MIQVVEKWILPFCGLPDAIKWSIIRKGVANSHRARRDRNGRFRVLKNENLRYYDEKSGRWYVIHWDDVLKCFVTELEPSEHPAGVVKE